MGVKIEIFRMVLYLTFPVTVFWISNQAEYFEEYVVKRKRKELEDFKEEIRARREERLSQKMAMESENSRRK
uniref:PET100 cytochrome c oxidase chaperone n=1 Tax=Cynoglossus semilaevis TaxID=244447 RepID=A0A3P8VZY9_CYNSE